MNEVIKFLSENPVEYLATLGLDGQAKVRQSCITLKKWKTLLLYKQPKANV